MKRYVNLKNIVFVILITTIMSVLTGCTSLNESAKGTKLNIKEGETRVLDYNEVKDSIIRFHVIANSDSEEDQNLKLEVKNKVIDYLYPYLNASNSLEESRKIIEDKMMEVKEIADKVIKNDGYNYEVKVQLSRENFPDKSYGNITLPEGNYEAFRIIIGNGQGKNWWCVMFPPLCFVDESKAEVEYDKTENRIKSSQEESSLSEGRDVDNEKSEKNNIEIKFKILEVLKQIFK